MTTLTADQLSREKTKSFQLRQRDQGWGYAFAWLVPFCGLYYCCTRRTITPFLYTLIGNFLAGIILGNVIYLSNPDADPKSVEGLGAFVGLVATPLLAKKGISQAREYGKRQLKSHNLSLVFTEEVKPANK